MRTIICFGYIVVMLSLIGCISFCMSFWNKPKNINNMLYAVYISVYDSNPFLVICLLSILSFAALTLYDICIGHISALLFLCIILLGITGLYGFLHMEYWQINVYPEGIKIHRLFKKAIHAENSDVTCNVNKHDKIIIYINGKKTLKISMTAENSERFLETFGDIL